MDNNILLSSKETIFEPHIRIDRKLPFIYHTDHTCGKRVSNFHENPELLYILEGCGTVTNDSKEYAVQKGSLVVVNSYCVHQVSSAEPMKYFCLIIDSSFCKQHHVDISTLHFNELICDRQIDDLFSSLIAECDGHNRFKETAIIHLVLEIILHLCRNYSNYKHSTTGDKESPQKRIHTAVQYIKKNIQKKLTVCEIADSVGLSQYHFMREFKRITGCTLSNYINMIRCEYAKELLQTGQYKVKEVAFMCGFESESYFINVFKKHTASLPSEHIRSIPASQ